MDEFERLRGRLFGIAYRMLGTATDAEEIVQDAWVRWQGADRTTVRDPAAYLAKVVTNLSMKQLTSARVRRETYVGAWLPEPVLTGRAEFDALGPLEVVAERDGVRPGGSPEADLTTVTVVLSQWPPWVHSRA